MFGALTRRAGGVAAAQAALAVAAIGTDMLLARMLDREANGLLQSAFIVVRVTVLAGALGIPTSLYFLFPRTGGKAQRRLIGQSFLILLLVAGVLAVALWAAAPWLAALLGQPSEVTTLIRAGSVAVAVALPALLAEPLFILHERAWLAAANAAAGAAIQIALVAWFLAGGAGLESVFFAMAAASLLRLIAPLVFWMRKSAKREAAGAGEWRESLRTQAAVAFPIGLTGAIDAASAYVDRSVIARLFDPAELALYRYGAQEVPFIGLLIGALTPVLLPRFSAMVQAGERREVLGLWHRASTKVAVVLFGILWALVWVAPDFLSVLYSERYREAALFFRIYLLMLPLRVVAFMPMLYALGRGRFVAAMAAVEVILSLALALVLIRGAGVGMAGAAWATVIATGIQAAVYLAAIRRGLECRWGEILPWKDLGRSLGVAGVFFLPLAGLRFTGMPSHYTVAVAMGWGAVYLATVTLTGLSAGERGPFGRK